MSELEDLSDAFCSNETICTLNTIIAPIFFFIIGVLISMGNSLTILAVYKSKKLRTPSNLHIVSLAVADMLVGLNAFSTAVLHISSVSSNKDVVRGLCIYDNILWMTGTSASAFSLATIAVDRYIYILYPLKYELWITIGKTKMVLALTWVVSSVLGFSILIFRDKIASGECIFIFLLTSGYYFSASTIPFILIFMSVTVIYTRIITVAFQQQKRINATGNASNGGLWRFKLKNLKLLVTVCGLYLCCWLPFHILTTLYMATGVLNSAMSYTNFLGLINSLLNFAIYPWMNKDFRAAYVSTVCCCKPSGES